MEFECIQYSKDQGVGQIVLNRPKVLNAMNKQLWLDFQTALDDAQIDPQVHCVIITGAGRAFSTGADLKESKNRSIDQYRDYLEALQQASLRIIRFPKPTIAAINGYALGSGYELALACDLRIAATDAQIGSPEARVASSLTGGAFQLLQQLVGPGKAKELLFTAENIDGLRGPTHRAGEQGGRTVAADGGGPGNGRQNRVQLGLFDQADQEGASSGERGRQFAKPDGLRNRSLPGMRFMQGSGCCAPKFRRPQTRRGQVIVRWRRGWCLTAY
jgi:hypothetical protein